MHVHLKIYSEMRVADLDKNIKMGEMFNSFWFVNKHVKKIIKIERSC